MDMEMDVENNSSSSTVATTITTATTSSSSSSLGATSGSCDSVLEDVMDEVDTGTQCNLLASQFDSQCHVVEGKTSNSNGDANAAASDFPPGVELRHISDNVGWGVFATRDFAEGEILFSDTPIVSCQFAWNRLYGYKACDYCIRALETAEENARRLMQKHNVVLPYPECCVTKKEFHVACPDCDNLYCSEECRLKAWEEFHQVLCPLTKVPKDSHPLKVLDQFWRLIHYPPETSNIFLLVKLLVRLHFDKNHTLRNRLAQFCQGSIDENNALAHKMLGKEYTEQVDKLRLLVSTVANFDNVQEWLTPAGFTQLLVLIGRNGQGVGSSAFAPWVERIEKHPTIDPDEKVVLLAEIDEYYAVMDQIVGHFLDNEGSALYPIQSWVNHSCVPNTEVKFPNRNHDIGLVAKRDIVKGEEITITYLDLGDMERSRYSRNKYLKEHYLFTCNCERCQSQEGEEEETSEDDDDDDDEDDEDIDEDGCDEIVVDPHPPTQV